MNCRKQNVLAFNYISTQPAKRVSPCPGLEGADREPAPMVLPVSLRILPNYENPSKSDSLTLLRHNLQSA